MKKIYTAASALLVGALMITGCGGSDDGSSNNVNTTTGVFVDSPVQGVQYDCSSGVTGLTDNLGQFTCNTDDTITFSINGFELGSATVQPLVTPAYLNPEDAAAALDVAQLLQTLDSDGNASNGINVAQSGDLFDSMKSMADNGVEVGQADFDSVATSYIGEILVDESTAQEHLDQYLTDLLVGKTLYTTIYDQQGTLESWIFSDDISSGSWQELVGGDESGTVVVSVTGLQLTFTDEDGIVIMTAEEITDSYIQLRNDETSQRLYFDRDAAEAYFNVTESALTLTTVPYDSNVTLVYTDPEGDVTLSGIDVTEIQMAFDDQNIYMTIDRAGLDFPEDGIYYNYWIYFTSGGSTVFSIENFHDNAGSHYLRYWEGRGYEDSQNYSWEQVLSHNQTSTPLSITVPRSGSNYVIDTTLTYTVSIFTHAFNNNVNIDGESESDTKFMIDFE